MISLNRGQHPVRQESPSPLDEHTDTGRGSLSQWVAEGLEAQGIQLLVKHGSHFTRSFQLNTSPPHPTPTTKAKATLTTSDFSLLKAARDQKNNVLCHPELHPGKLGHRHGSEAQLTGQPCCGT